MYNKKFVWFMASIAATGGLLFGFDTGVISGAIPYMQSDLNISDRLEKGFAKLQEKMSEISKLSSEDENLSELLNKANTEMCEWLDYIFDSPVSEVFSKGGSMYDPKDGMFRYEHIIDGLTKLYTDNLNQEYKKMRARIQKHTEKYTGKKKK